ncbi:hypothetical protein B0H11DRAFT_2019164 [Mycena galericulata]|nr:hypothetical protein B0H11DRAFT_2019164 [Mycena galericulata]
MMQGLLSRIQDPRFVYIECPAYGTVPHFTSLSNRLKVTACISPSGYVEQRLSLDTHLSYIYSAGTIHSFYESKPHIECPAHPRCLSVRQRLRVPQSQMYIVKAVIAFLLASAGVDDSPVNFDATPILVAPTAVRLVNHAANHSVFTFSDSPQLDIFISQDFETGFSVWNMEPVGGDKYTFTNNGTGQPLVVNTTNYLITTDGEEPTVFAVDNSGSGEDVIKLPDVNQVWTATFDSTGTCPMFGTVKLDSATGNPSQHWTVVNVED